MLIKESSFEELYRDVCGECGDGWAFVQSPVYAELADKFVEFIHTKNQKTKVLIVLGGVTISFDDEFAQDCWFFTDRQPNEQELACFDFFYCDKETIW